MPVKRGSRGGMTLVEVLVAAALCAVLVGLAGTMVITLFNLTENQNQLVAANQQGLETLDSIGKALDDAVIPIHVNAVHEPVEGQTAWDAVDSPDTGFGGKGAAGAGRRWRDALITGVDNIAFAQLVKVLGSTYDNRYDKSDPARSDPSVESRVLLGQVRGGKGYLGAGVLPRTNPDGEYRFDFGGASEPVNILARLDPDKFNAPGFERIALPRPADWQGVTLSGYNRWPDRTAFMAIRYIPLDNPATGSPWVISEAAGFRGGRIDLDGDGAFDGSFNVGRLQLLYSGGSDLFTENAAGTELVPASLEQMAVDLTRDIVLRRADAAGRVPIFQLADPAPAGAGVRKDDLGAYVRVRLLLADNSGVDAGGLRASPYAKTLAPRWYESSVFMSNMRR